MTYTAAQAIDRSISHSEIVTLDHDEDAILALTIECDDHVEGNDVIEFWGSRVREFANETEERPWRVHVQLLESEP